MSEAKKFDSDKAPLALIDPRFIEEIARVCAMGEQKYGANNWRGLTVERLISAVKRHLASVEISEDIDEESGYSHIAHAASGLMFINWILANRPEQDDRRWAGSSDTPSYMKKWAEEYEESAPVEEKPEPATRTFSGGSIADTQRLIAGWADEVFPDRTISEAVFKMKKELLELEGSKHLDPGEFADVAILLLDIAHLAGVDIAKAVEDKMRVNVAREWVKLEDGTRQHVKPKTLDEAIAEQPAPVELPLNDIRRVNDMKKRVYSWWAGTDGIIKECTYVKDGYAYTSDHKSLNMLDLGSMTPISEVGDTGRDIKSGDTVTFRKVIHPFNAITVVVGGVTAGWCTAKGEMIDRNLYVPVRSRNKNKDTEL